MNDHDAQILIDTIRKLVTSPTSLDVVGTTGGKATVATTRPADPPPARGKESMRFAGQPLDARAHAGDGDGAARAAGAGLSPDAFEQLYTTIKNRIIDECRLDPILLKLLISRPELVVEVEPRLVSIDGVSLKGRLARLMGNGFFKAPRRVGEVKGELIRTGTEPNGGNLSTAISDYVRDGFLTREGEGYALAAGVKVTERELSVK